MPPTETYNEQTKKNAPAILELLCELESRDKDSKGAVQPGSIAGSTLGDPRGYTVLNTTGHDVGTVKDLYVDPNTRQPFFALLSLGSHTLGIGNRQVLVRYSDLEAIDDRKVRVQTTLP